MLGLIACRRRWITSILALDSVPITTARICSADGCCHCSASLPKPCPICRRRPRSSRTHGKRTYFLRVRTLSSDDQRTKKSRELGRRRKRRRLVESYGGARGLSPVPPGGDARLSTSKLRSTKQ